MRSRFAKIDHETPHISWDLGGRCGTMLRSGRVSTGGIGVVALVLLLTLTPRTAYTECTTVKPLLFSFPCDLSGSYVASFETFFPRVETLQNTLDLTLIDEATPDESTVVTSYDGVLSLQGHMFNFRSPPPLPFLGTAEILWDVSGEVEWAIRDGEAGWLLERGIFTYEPRPSSLPCLGNSSGDRPLTVPSTWQVFPEVVAESDLTDAGFNTRIPFAGTRTTKDVATAGACVPVDCVPEPGFSECDVSLGLTTSTRFDLAAGITAMPSEGTIKGRLTSVTPLMILDDDGQLTETNTIERATVELFEQDTSVREQSRDELVEEYITFLQEQGRFLLRSNIVIPETDGKFSFEHLPVIDLESNEILYTIQVSDARTEVVDPNDPSRTRVTHFEQDVLPNVVPEEEDPFTITEHGILLIPLEGFVVNTTLDAEDLARDDDECAISVTPVGETPTCTLRAAIQQANATPGRDLITFDIPGPPPHTITPQSKLPSLKDPVIIDGSTQPRGEPDEPKIILDGRLAGPNHGYVVKAASEIIGQRIINFEGVGIKLTRKGGGSSITGNIIGIADGGLPGANSQGIHIKFSSNNTIGGITAVPGKAPGNVISGNRREGISILADQRVEGNATGNVIMGNLIGTIAAAVVGQERGNGHDGVFILNADHTVIGGTQAGAGNVISGNGTLSGEGILEGFGVKIFGSMAEGNQVIGNLIGINTAGDGSLGNRGSGVDIQSAPRNIIRRNEIGGNGRHGVDISGEGARGNIVQRNLIGETSNGVHVPNDESGVRIRNQAKKNTIGGMDPDDGNTITTDNHSGVVVRSQKAKNNAILSNNIKIVDVQPGITIGIDLGNDGVTDNDEGDDDKGPNKRQNFPTLLKAC